MAVAQPLLSVFGDNPEFFVFLRADRADTVVYALVVVLVPPLVLGIVVAGARLAGVRAAAIAQVLAVAVLVYAFVVQLVTTPSPGLLGVLIGLAAAGLVVWLYRSFGGVRTWTRVLAVVPVVAAVGFVFGSDTSEVFTAAAVKPLAAEEVLVDDDAEPPPLVMIVFDEFPTRTLLAADGTIDATRFPNFARLADISTWYRSHSTTASRTEGAVPSMVTGLPPRDVRPLFYDYPDTIFRLLGDTHHITSSEAFTALCPPSQCGQRPIPPPTPTSDEADPAAPPPSTLPAASFDAESLYDRTVDVFLDRILPGRDAEGTTTDFAEVTVDVDTTLAPTSSTGATSTGETGTGATTTSAAEAEADADIAHEDFWIRVRTVPDTQLARHGFFLDSLTPTAEPTFWFHHLILPHLPWRFHPDGTEYDQPDDLRFDIARHDPWFLELNQARHAMQTEYTDALLGQIMARLDEIGILDEAIVVAVGDHGVSFELNTHDRDIEGPGQGDVLYVPLFIKGPGQTVGEVSEVNASLFDILPTIAGHLGVQIPWDVEGVDLNSAAVRDRDGTKTAYRFQNEFESSPTAVLQYQQEDLDAELLRPGLPEPGRDDDRFLGRLYDTLGPAADLIDESFSALARPGAGGVAQLEQRDRLESPGTEDPPVGLVIGQFTEPVPDTAIVVVAVDDRIVALSPIVDFAGSDRAFVAQLPPDVLAPGGRHRIDIGWHTEAGGLASVAVG